MTEQLISFETAKLAKEKGYKFAKRDNSVSRNSIDIIPTHSLLQKWLREVHNLYVTAIPYNDEELSQILWENNIIDVKDDWNDFSDYTLYHSYEEALEAGLQEALKLIET